MARSIEPGRSLALAFLLAACGARSDLRLPTSTRDAGPMDARSIGDAASSRDTRPTDGDAPLRDARFDGPPDDACAPVRLELARTPPAVMLILDRSGSMDRVLREATIHYPEPASRWELVVETLVLGPRGGLVGTREDRVRFGAMTFTASFESCPDLDVVMPTLNAHSAIRDMLVRAEPGGGTPTGETIEEAVTLLEDEPDVGGRPVLILATDGEPNSCTGADGERRVLEAVRAAFERGHRTLVVSIADEIRESHLSALADIGAGAPVGTGTPFFPGTSYVELGAALDAAIRAATECRAELPSWAHETPCEALELRLGGTRLECGRVDGFRLAGSSTIELLGAACARVRDAIGPVRLELGCAP